MADIATERRCPTWVKIVLGLSLAINLAIVGLVGGFVLSGGPMGGKGPRMGYAMPYVLALPKEDRRAIFRALRENPDLPGRGERRAAYREMVVVLKADTFDPAGAKGVLERHARGVEQVQQVAQGEWLNRVSAMSIEDRRSYALQVEEMVAKGGDRKPRQGQ